MGCAVMVKGLCPLDVVYLLKSKDIKDSLHVQITSIGHQANGIGIHKISHRWGRMAGAMRKFKERGKVTAPVVYVL